MDQKVVKEKILEVYKECKIRTFPIDCIALLEHYGIRTITYEEVKDNNPALYMAIRDYSKDALRFKMTVYYNTSSTTIGRIRFSLMHELGHFILRHAAESPENEAEADFFASHILIPRVVISAQKYSTADEIHDYFKVSYAASNRALTDYKRWSQEEESAADKELKIWLYYPNFYRHRERHFKTYAREKAKIKKKLELYEEFRLQIEDSIGPSGFEEYIWNRYDRTFYP